MKNTIDMLRRALNLQNQGEFAKAEKLYDKVLEIEPRQFDALHLLGLLMHQRGDSAKALRLIASALEINPTSPEALLNYGSVLSALNRHEEALTYYDEALVINPFFPSALKNRGNALSELNRHEEALACFKQALALKPGDAAMLFSCGNALRELGRHDEALALYRDVLKRQPDNAAILNNCGNEFALLGHVPEALACFDRALELNPNDAETFIYRANALLVGDRYEEALACFDQALTRKPDHAKAHYDRGMTRLARRELAQGWEDYEWRCKMPNHVAAAAEFPQPRWSGEYVTGTLLARGEQGLGDEIIYASMVPDLLTCADSVVLQVEPRLTPLFSRSFPNIRVTARGEPLSQDIKAQSPLGSLGRYLRPDWNAFPRREHGYLLADRDLTAKLRQRVAPRQEFVIGLSWVSKNPRYGQLKTARLSDFEPVLRLPGCRYVDLQYGDTLAEREALRQTTGLVVERLEDVDSTNDLDALAALITACDLVITVSNTTAHLAGALGKTALVLVPYGQGQLWYWFDDADDSPWYPHVRIKRQQQGQPWKELLASAAEEIAAQVKIARPLQPA